MMDIHSFSIIQKKKNMKPEYIVDLYILTQYL